MEQITKVSTGRDIAYAAQEEIENEDFREAVEAKKKEIRELQKKKPWWYKVFPWKIYLTIERR